LVQCYRPKGRTETSRAEHYFNPASGVSMAVLASGKIPYGEWGRFVLPLVGMWFVICIGALIVGVWINRF
jgi:uncharacterized ion transporter superfamily protein YfcC